ncbi:MAG: hydantoinase B/oxoprolinase family protein [Alphaproteobacteria bacterium]|nr:hydantoinase B/oxoprolinase family protein [Alphaproteobacteria bacterium]
MTKHQSPSDLGPIELEVIHGTIRAAELEIEAAVERTARSPMIRDQHDYRVALFDAKGRKLTGRSYSAIVEPVFEYFGEDDINPGDVFFWNDPYNSCGGIGHVPDLCTTVPIFHGDRLIGFSQVFGHHDDIGGSVPGSLPVHATDSWMEGVLIPPIKLYDGGVLNDAAFKIIVRNSRLSEHLAGDLDAEIGAAKLGSRRIVALAERYGVDTLESAFEQIIRNTAEIFRREIFPKIKDGTYHYEDYIEADGVDEPRLHALRLTMTKTPEKIILDFNGTDPEAKGPINWSLDEVEGRYFRKWLAPVLRSLASSPERAAEIDSNEGVLDVIEIKFPEKGTLITPTFSKPTGMRFFLMLRSLGIFAACLSKATGGKMPADHETIRIWGLTGGGTQEEFYLFREVLGGGGPGRPWADGSDVVHIVPNSRNLPAEFSEIRYPIMVEQLALKRDSGGAGYRRGGLGYDKRIRALEECRLISNADRSILGCYGVNGGQAGMSYQVSMIDQTGNEAVYPGMCDTVVVPPDASVRVVTTGGGGWGDPLDREIDMVVYDLQCGLITEQSARDDYGVVVHLDGRKWVADREKTEEHRASIRKERGALPMFDRGGAFDAMKQSGKVNYPNGWTDPDQDWNAVGAEID